MGTTAYNRVFLLLGLKSCLVLCFSVQFPYFCITVCVGSITAQPLLRSVPQKLPNSVK